MDGLLTVSYRFLITYRFVIYTNFKNSKESHMINSNQFYAKEMAMRYLRKEIQLLKLVKGHVIH